MTGLDRKYDGPRSYTAPEIREMLRWANFNGFTADSCGKCRKTVNVLAGGPGFFCACGHYNIQSWHCFQIPHERPDYGPAQATIQEGLHGGTLNVRSIMRERGYRFENEPGDVAPPPPYLTLAEAQRDAAHWESTADTIGGRAQIYNVRTKQIVG